jgi:hypothetical protein
LPQDLLRGSHRNLSHIHRDAETFRGGAVAALNTTLEARRLALETATSPRFPTVNLRRQAVFATVSPRRQAAWEREKEDIDAAQRQLDPGGLPSIHRSASTPYRHPTPPRTFGAPSV